MKTWVCKGGTPGNIIVPKDRKRTAVPKEGENDAQSNVKNLHEEGPKLYRELMKQQK